MKAIWLSLTVLLLVVAVGIGGVVVWRFYRITDCISGPFNLLDCTFAGGDTSQGGACGLDFECEGWSALGKVACCNNECVTKDFTTQTCSAFVAGEGRPCSQPDGTIWPFSGCDVSAGICCNRVCSKSCAARPQGGECVLDTDCAGWSLFGKVACCNNQCVTKDFSVQTCPDYLSRR